MLLLNTGGEYVALTKPILYTPAAFDASQAYSFTFNVIGGDQVVANQLVIKNQQTGVTVYNQTQRTYAFIHTVPAGTLSNGSYYSAYLVTYNAFNNSSPQSSSVQFYCFATPSWAFSNIPSGGAINNASFDFNVQYSQNQGETLSSYSIVLYDDQYAQISTSGVKYTTDVVSPVTVSHTFSGFNDDTTYYVRAIGRTTHGMQLDTGYVQISVSYTPVDVFADIELINNCRGGYVTVKSNLFNIEGKSQPIPPLYVNNGTMVDSRSSGSYVLWDNNFSIDGDFTASLWGRQFNNGTIIEMTDDTQSNRLVVTYSGTSTTARVSMSVYENGSPQPVWSGQSSEVSLWGSLAKLQIWIRRNNGTYTISLHTVDSEPSASAKLGTAVLGYMRLGRS